MELCRLCSTVLTLAWYRWSTNVYSRYAACVRKLFFFSDKCIEGIWAIMQHSLRLNQYTFCDNDVNEYQISIAPPHGSYICNRMPHLFCLSAHIRSSHTTSLSKSTQNFLKLTLTRGWCIIIWIAGYQCATMQWSTQNKLNFRYPFFDS